jgi:sporulation protein YlmC with PRC-barrel domain
MANKKKRLQELRGSGFEIAKHQPDIRGWEVRDRSGHLMGKVQELIFDSRAHKVRYMVVNVVDSKELQLEKRTVLIPIGLAVLQPKDDDVILENVTPFQLRALPRYHKDDLGSRSERAISEVFGKKDNKAVADTEDDVENEFYNHEYFNEDNMYRNRQQANTNATAATQQSIINDQYKTDRREDETTTRREDNLNTTSNINTTSNSNETKTKETVVVQRMEGETDEEYIRRIMKNVDNK